MAKTYEDHISNCKAHFRKAFKNFTAHITNLGPVQILDWKNKNDSITYYIRFLFDKTAQRMTVSGDLGTAVFHFTEEATFEAISSYLTLEYFLEKIDITTNRHQYDSEYAYIEVKQNLNIDNMTDETERIKLTDLAKRIAEEMDMNGLEETTKELLEEYDPDYWEWVYEIGKLPHKRCIGWFEALHMARKQLLKGESL